MIKQGRDCYNNALYIMNELIKQIEKWGKDKGILDKASPQTQFLKLDEEVNELHEGIVSGDKDAISDAIGDCAVVLILMARLCDMEFGECLNGAYSEIRNRTGEMKNGVFVKDSGNDKRSEPGDES